MNPLAPDHRPWLAPLAWLYGAGRRAHRALYTTGIVAPRLLSRPVVCVGNVSVGGTGKTPFIIMLAGQLAARGLRPCVLSRGYRAQPPVREPRIVSDGRGTLLGAAESGDEPLLIARACPGVPVVICPDRHAAGLLAERQFNPDLFLLDDGFQHEALARDADLVLWDVRDDPARAMQLPAGRMRESPRALRRASAIILTHAEYLPDAGREAGVNSVIIALKRRAPAVPIFQAVATLSGIHTLAAEAGLAPADPATLAGRPVILLSGLARPEGFEALARSAGAEIRAHLTYPDHADHDEAVIAGAVRLAEEKGADFILTTGKDAVKLVGRAHDLSRFRVAELAMTMTEPARWGLFLDNLLRDHPPVAEMPKEQP